MYFWLSNMFHSFVLFFSDFAGFSGNRFDTLVWNGEMTQKQSHVEFLPLPLLFASKTVFLHAECNEMFA